MNEIILNLFNIIVILGTVFSFALSIIAINKKDTNLPLNSDGIIDLNSISINEYINTGHADKFFTEYFNYLIDNNQSEFILDGDIGVLNSIVNNKFSPTLVSSSQSAADGVRYLFNCGEKVRLNKKCSYDYSVIRFSIKKIN